MLTTVPFCISVAHARKSLSPAINAVSVVKPSLELHFGSGSASLQNPWLRMYLLLSWLDH
jgi:hypothetical protein